MTSRLEIIILVGVFIIVTGCFSIPIIIFSINSQQDRTRINVHFNVNHCNQQSNNTPFESIYVKECSHYEGVCSAHLQELAANDDTLITASNNLINEQQLLEFFSTLESLSAVISEECLVTVIPFLCQYAYPPCDVNGSAQFIIQEQCINIRSKVCKREWGLAMTTEQGNLLPVCETFSANDESGSSTIKNNAELLQCHYQFREYCGVCLPLCGTFSQYPNRVRFGEKAIILAAILALIGGFIICTAAVIRRSEMLVFPQVLTMYTILSANIIALFILISYIGGQENLYCSHETLHLSILEPSVFTQLSGFIFHFSLVFMSVTWFLHLFHLFLGAVFPFWSRFLSEKKWKIKLHISEVLGSVLLCSLAPTIYVSVSEYTLGRFPPLFALPSRGVAFYTIVLPLVIVFAAGVNIAFYTFLSIHKSYGLFIQGKTRCINFSVPEVKILILLSYFIVFGIMTLANFSVSINEADPFLDDLFRYFACQLGGFDPKCEDIRHQFERHLRPGLNAVTYLLMGTITWVYLLFAIQSQDVKKLARKMTTYYCSSTKAL